MKTKSQIPLYSIIQRHKSRGIKTWYGRCYFLGKISYVSLKTENRRVAQEWLDKMNVARFFGTSKVWGMVNQNPIIPDKIADEYIALPRMGNSQITVRDTLAHFLEFCRLQNIEDLSVLTKEQAQDFVSFVAEKGIKPKRVVLRAKSLLKFAFEKLGIEKSNPFSGIVLAKEVKKEKTVWTAEEVDLLVRNAHSPEYRMLFALMAYAGLRISEAAKFTADDIRGDEFRVLGKGKKVAVLPISAKLREEIDMYKGEFPLLFTANRVQYSLKKECERLGIEKGTAHCFRHSYATNLARVEPNVKVTQQLMRHASSVMTLEVYTHVVSEDLKKAVEKI